MDAIVFVDVDGTLIPPFTNKVPESTLCAFRNLKHNNIGIVLCTGRHFIELEQLDLLQFPYDGYVTLNGQICLDGNYNIIDAFPIVGEACSAIIEAFETRDYPVVISEVDKMYVNFVNKRIAGILKEIYTEMYPVGTYSKRDIYMATVYTNNTSLIRCKELSCNHWNEYAIDVYSGRGGKVNGIKAFMKKYLVCMENVYAFGDAENDIDMLQYAGTGIAMGNASEVVKEKADIVTSRVDDDGIYYALKKLGLINNQLKIDNG